LNGVSLTLPPLRDRMVEIRGLAEAFIALACRQLGRTNAPRLSAEALALLEAYRWPGNIRELRNVIERAVLLCTESTITVEHLPADKMRSPLVPSATPASSPPPSAPPPSAHLREEIDALERQRILDALAQCAGNQTQAAKLLGMSRATLVARLDAYGAPRPRKNVKR
jgi:DNA-binding NtrC family response regulator